MQYIPRQGTSITQNNAGNTALDFGTIVTATVAIHTKNTTFTTLIATTDYTAYGITIGVGGVGTGPTTNERMLVDIAIGAAASEVVIVPDLLAGTAGTSSSNSSEPSFYHFPIVIPAGSRISARNQALIASDNVNVQVHLHQQQVPGKWYGSRVTAYGIDAAASTGTSHTAVSGSYATSTQLTASTTNPIKYLQVGHDLLTDTTGTTTARYLRIAAMSSTNYIVSDLPIRESTSVESVDFTMANFILSKMNFSIPSGQYLGVGARMVTTAEARGYALYGVD